jgi:hypothetical protein
LKRNKQKHTRRQELKNSKNLLSKLVALYRAREFDVKQLITD